MFNNISIGQYFPTDSFVHRLDPRVKLIFVFVFMIAIFFVDSYSILALVGITIISLILMSKVPLKIILRGLKPMRAIIIMTLIFNIFFTPGTQIFPNIKWPQMSYEGLNTGLFMSFRLLLLILGSSLLTLTTSPIRLTDGLESLMSPLKLIKVPTHELAMMMTIALRFIPTLAEEANKIKMAQESRGASFDGKNIIETAKKMLPLMIPLFLNALKRADELAIAMDARCYSGGEHRGKLNPLIYTTVDRLAILVIIIYFGFIISTKYLFNLIWRT